MGVISREAFDKMTTFSQYVDLMKANKDQMAQFTDEVSISDEDVAWWKSQGKINVVVLTFDGCGDALYNIPIIAKIGKLASNVDVRVIQRDDNLDIMNKYLNQGQFQSVPTFIFLDENLNEIGNLKERASDMTKIMEAEMLAARRQARVTHKDAWRTLMSKELRATVAEKKQSP